MNELYTLLNKIVTVYTVPTSIPIQPERFPVVFTGTLKGINYNDGFIVLENTFYGNNVQSLFFIKHIISIAEEPEIDQNSEEYQQLLKDAENVKKEQLEKLKQELMPQAMNEVKMEASALHKAEIAKKLKASREKPIS